MPKKKSSTTKPDLGSLEVTEELIRQRAYGYYEQRGREDGHDLEDWLRAEAAGDPFAWLRKRLGQFSLS